MQQLLGADRQEPPFVAAMSNGTSGNINNNDYSKPREQRERYQQIRLVADQCAQAVFQQYPKLTWHDWVPLGMRQRELELAVRKPTPAQLEHAKQVLAEPERPDKFPHERAYAQKAIQQLESPDTVRVMLQSVRIGELGIFAIPFEVFSEIGLELKARSPFQPSFTMELANGGYGYLPTPEQHELGGYENMARHEQGGVQASTKIVDALLKMFSELLEGCRPATGDASPSLQLRRQAPTPARGSRRRLYYRSSPDSSTTSVSAISGTFLRTDRFRACPLHRASTAWLPCGGRTMPPACR